MEAEDLPRIESLFHAALEVPPAERAAFLARECEGELELRAEVESLIAVFEKREDFLENPAFNAGLKALSADLSELLTGKLIGAYKVQRLLGKGGMGEVYLAEDTRLGRLVALKFLARRLATDAWARKQLIKEAQAAAMLDHPNICAVYGLEEADGYSFIVMQYVEGEVLSELARTGRLNPKQTLPLALQMVGALAEAHAHGILHRDIKPQNLILTVNGQLKVLDFGLAKVIQGKRGASPDSLASQNGLIAGTVAYMSPEQLRAERLDFRSDIYSVGTVLYELVSGKHPFAQGNDAETIAAILTSQPPTPHGANGLTQVINRCLKKDKEQRYQSASELLLDLQTSSTRNEAPKPRRRFKSSLVAALLGLFGLGGMFVYLQLTKVPVLAVLPFVNVNAGSEENYLIYGLNERLANQLSRLPQLKVKGTNNFSVVKIKQGEIERIQRELGADVVLTGTASVFGEELILQVKLIATKDGNQLWDASYDLNKIGALAVQTAVVAEVAARLRSPVNTAEQKLLSLGQTTKSEAFYEYLRGRHYLNKRGKENIEKAIGHFNTARDLDPAYALAHTGLADSYVLLPSVAHGQMPTKEAMGKAAAAARQALAIDDTLPEAHTSLGVVKLKYEWDWRGAEHEFNRAIELNANYAQAHYWYSHLLLVTGRPGAALAESEIASELDPFSASQRLHRCRARFQTRQFDEADRCLNKILEEEPGNSNSRYVRGFVYLEKKRYEEAIGIFRELYKENPSLAATGLGYACGRAGKHSEAWAILAEMEKRAQETYVPSQEFAIIYIGLRDYDRAFQWLEKAYEERFAYLPFLNLEPLVDPLRQDARFADLLKRLNLTP